MRVSGTRLEILKETNKKWNYFLQHFTASRIMGFQEKGLQITLAKEKQVSIFWWLGDFLIENKQINKS